MSGKLCSPVLNGQFSDSKEKPIVVDSYTAQSKAKIPGRQRCRFVCARYRCLYARTRVLGFSRSGASNVTVIETRQDSAVLERLLNRI